MKFIALFVVAALLSACAGGVTGSLADRNFAVKATVAKDGVILGGSIEAH
jgi:hypothetical protein